MTRATDIEQVLRSAWRMDLAIAGSTKIGPRRSTFGLTGDMWLAVAEGNEGEMLRREARLLGQLDGRAGSIAVPMIVRTAAGGSCHEDEHGATWRITKSVPGSIARDAVRLSWPALSGGIARLSEALNASYATPVRNDGVVTVACRLLAGVARDANDAGPVRTASILRAGEYLETRLDSLAALPVQLCHGDCHLPNLFVDGRSELCAIIDFEFAATDPAVVDLAALLASLVIDSGLDELPKRARQLFAEWTDAGRAGSFRDLLASFVCTRLALYAHHRDRPRPSAEERDKVLAICADYIDVAVSFAEECAQ